MNIYGDKMKRPGCQDDLLKGDGLTSIRRVTSAPPHHPGWSLHTLHGVCGVIHMEGQTPHHPGWSEERASPQCRTSVTTVNQGIGIHRNAPLGLDPLLQRNLSLINHLFDRCVSRCKNLIIFYAKLTSFPRKVTPFCCVIETLPKAQRTRGLPK